MLLHGSRLLLTMLAMVIAMLSSYSPSAIAQPQSRLAFCLNLAQAVQAAYFAEKKKYIVAEDDLRRQLTSGCAGLRYEISMKAGGGFRVISESNGEAWGIDEKRELIQLSEGKGGGSAPSSSSASSGSSASTRAPSGAQVQGAPTAPPTNPAAPQPFLGGGDKQAPSSSGVNVPAGVSISTNSTGGQDRTVSPDQVASSRMQQCFPRAAFHSESCRTLFSELDKQCGKDDVPLARLCLELESLVANVNMGDCVGDDENYGKCELRRRSLEKKCSNRLRQSSSECRGLAKYLASVVPESSDGGGRGQNRLATTDIGAVGKAPPGAIARSLDGTLRTVLRLRPVMYETKGRPQEMGFVAEEVETVNPTLISYNARGQIEGVKYSQFMSLLTGGLQEVYGMCKQDGDLAKDLIRRMVLVEAENKELKRENAELRKMIFNINNDIQTIKDNLPKN